MELSRPLLYSWQHLLTASTTSLSYLGDLQVRKENESTHFVFLYHNIVTHLHYFYCRCFVHLTYLIYTITYFAMHVLCIQCTPCNVHLQYPVSTITFTMCILYIQCAPLYLQCTSYVSSVHHYVCKVYLINAVSSLHLACNVQLVFAVCNVYCNVHPAFVMFTICIMCTMCTSYIVSVHFASSMCTFKPVIRFCVFSVCARCVLCMHKNLKPIKSEHVHTEEWMASLRL